MSHEYDNACNGCFTRRCSSCGVERNFRTPYSDGRREGVRWRRKKDKNPTSGMSDELNRQSSSTSNPTSDTALAAVNQSELDNDGLHAESLNPPQDTLSPQMVEEDDDEFLQIEDWIDFNPKIIDSAVDDEGKDLGAPSSNLDVFEPGDTLDIIDLPCECPLYCFRKHQDTHISTVYFETLPSFIDYAFGRFSFLHPEPPIREGEARARWTCVCCIQTVQVNSANNAPEMRHGVI